MLIADLFFHCSIGIESNHLDPKKDLVTVMINKSLDLSIDQLQPMLQYEDNGLPHLSPSVLSFMIIRAHLTSYCVDPLSCRIKRNVGVF